MMKFKKLGGRFNWKSDCGKYRVWRQGHLLNGEEEWAAQYLDEQPWIGDLYRNGSDAQGACREHAKEVKKKTDRN